MRARAASLRRRGAPAVAVLLLALAGPDPADGQIGGRVVDDRGRPVIGARVELRAGGEVVAWSHVGSIVLLCHRDEGGTELLLQASLDDDPGIPEITWRLQTPEPAEEAGGWMTFPDEPGPRPLPLPRSVYLWTRASDDRTRQELRTYGPWFVGSPDEVRRAIRDWHEVRGREDTP